MERFEKAVQETKRSSLSKDKQRPLDHNDHSLRSRKPLNKKERIFDMILKLKSLAHQYLQSNYLLDLRPNFERNVKQLLLQHKSKIDLILITQ